MSGYPFSDGIDDYVESLNATEASKDSARRRLGNIGRVFHQLKTEHKIPSDNPSRISVDGVRHSSKDADPMECRPALSGGIFSISTVI